jgi:hypothetical protein
MAAYVYGPHKFLVYGLRDPRTNEIRYVGKSTSGLGRPKAHFRESRRGDYDSHKSRWLRQLDAAGLRCEIVVLQACGNDSEAIAAERAWIAMGKPAGTLTNMTDGGEGRPGKGHRLSAEHCAKISAAHRASAAIKTAGRAWSEKARGKPRPPEVTEKMRRSLTGKRRSQAAIDKQRATMLAKKWKHTPEVLARLSAEWYANHPNWARLPRLPRPPIRINLLGRRP